MRTATRREIILTAAVATSAFGVNGQMAISAPERRAKTPDPLPGFYRYQVGIAVCTALYDGIWERAHGRGSGGLLRPAAAMCSICGSRRDRRRRSPHSPRLMRPVGTHLGGKLPE